MKFRSIKLKYQMMIVLGAFSVVIFSAFITLNMKYTRQVLLQESYERAVDRVRSTSLAIDGFFQEKAKVAWTIERSPRFRTWLSDNELRRVDRSNDQEYQDILSQIKAIKADDTDLQSVFFASDRTGEYFDESERDTGVDYFVTARPWFMAIKESDQPNFDFNVDLISHEMFIAYNYPVHDPDGRWLGVIGVDIKPQALEDQLMNLKMFESSSAMLVRNDGVILHHPDPAMVLETKITDPQEGETSGLEAAAKRIVSGETGIADLVYGGEERFFVFTPIKELGASLVLSVSKQEIFAQYERMVTLTVLLVSISLTLMLISLFFYARRITKPIEMIAGLCESFVIDSRSVGQDKQSEIAMLQQTFEGLCAYVDEVSDASNHIMTNNRSIVTEAHKQESMVCEATGALQNMTQRIDRSSSRTHEAGQTAMNAMASSQHGVEQVSHLTETMDVLQGSAKEMQSFINTIEEIALQTNMLALNAAIEAAHAGDFGRGFGVVADEIRQLSLRSSEAATHIAKVLNRTGDEIRQSAVISKEIMEQFNGFYHQINEVAEVMDGVKNDTEEHTETIHSVKKIIDSVFSITQGNVTKSEESSIGATQMADRAMKIRARLPHFESNGRACMIGTGHKR